MKEKPTKLEELILHITKLSRNDPEFNLEKLRALIFAADLESFKQTGKTITGEEYTIGP